MAQEIARGMYIGIAQVTLVYPDIEPSQALLQSSVERLEQHARELVPEILGSGFQVEAVADAGSLMEKCAVYASIAGLFVSLASTTPSQLANNIQEWKVKSFEFSEAIANALRGDPSKPAGARRDDQSVIVRRRTLALAKLERIVRGARDINAHPKSIISRAEFVAGVENLLNEAHTSDERAEIVDELIALPLISDALPENFGPKFRTDLRSRPKKVSIERESKPSASRAGAHGQATPKPRRVARRFIV